jgi:hypothetical protein
MSKRAKRQEMEKRRKKRVKALALETEAVMGGSSLKRDDA